MRYMCFRLVWVAIIIGTGWVNAQDKQHRKMHAVHGMSRNGTLNLTNSYGNIKLSGWQKNQVSITMDVSVSGRDKKNDGSLMERIQLKVEENSGGTINVSSIIEKQKEGFLAKYFGLGREMEKASGQIKIDLTVMLPSDANLLVQNKFGNLLIEDWRGRLTVEMAHGDIWLNTDLEQADINLKYGKLKANSLGRANIEIENGSIQLNRTDYMLLQSTGSIVNIGEIEELRITSSKDELYFDYLNEINGSLEFSDLNLRHLGLWMDLELDISELELFEILDESANLRIREESSQVIIHTTGFGCSLDALLEEGVIRIPKTYLNVKSTGLASPGSGRKRRVTANSGGMGNGSISLEGKKGIIVLKQN